MTNKLKIRKILIANRGEIALRVIRACREMGIISAAVYSEIDRKAPHVLLADEAYLIGPAPARESYLKADKIVETAKKCGADAIHPGYGFLAENSGFAQMCADEGIIFIGPPPNAISAMGSKTEARAIMTQAGVPVVPGCEAVEADESALKEAERLGYPVMIKAAYGGGGKGMRIVHEPGSLLKSLESASREALSSFGNGTVYLEKYLVNPRHIEIQILADLQGNVIHLGERECSIQRRHQKVIEEAPSPVIDEQTRSAMGEAAVNAAKACGYINAGTVEFMYSQGKFYFLEMNTRLQVEHPVTEMVTGVDLVKEQILIAGGEPLRYKQKGITRRGHAVECRIYSEDENFLPDTGILTEYIVPQGPGVRVDGGVYQGSEISVHYDPMIAKLIVWGEDRLTAIERMKRALHEYRISGVKTGIPFLLTVLNHQDFIEGDYHTGFIEAQKLTAGAEIPGDALRAMAAAAALFHAKLKEHQINKSSNTDNIPRKSGWLTAGRLEGIR
ncbi:acetyl-CoA carboxylase biotin carboxylase subunit [bacterium]|nr:acetyl-CoA carboxylase biotin carboxylase subunit [bacterium]